MKQFNIKTRTLLFFMGIILGMVGGAVLATNSVKARQVVKDGQEQVLEKAKEMQKSASQK